MGKTINDAIALVDATYNECEYSYLADDPLMRWLNLAKRCFITVNWKMLHLHTTLKKLVLAGFMGKVVRPLLLNMTDFYWEIHCR